jgi:predicted porin
VAAGVKLTANYVDRGTTTGSGLNAGTDGPAAAQPSFGLGVAYALGKINAFADYTGFTRQGDVTVATTHPTTLVVTVTSTAKSRVRLSGNYDFSVAKIGAGYSRLEYTNGDVATETAFGVSVPVGAITLGAQYGTKKTDATTNPIDNKGFTLGAQYDLSKRTNVSVSYFSFDKGNAIDNNGTRMFISHSF